MNELALFAGAGGGILGGKLLGWRTVCAVERDAYASQVLAQRQNDGLLETFPIWSDITTFDGKPWRGIVDVVSGGFPCQDISAAGKGAGIEGARSGMWKEMARIIGEVRPQYAFVENSPMLTTRGLGVVLADLASMGFDAQYGVLSAADVGANHQRERIWILAYSHNNGCAAFSQLRGNEAASNQWGQKKSVSTRQSKRTYRPIDVQSIRGCEIGKQPSFAGANAFNSTNKSRNTKRELANADLLRCDDRQSQKHTTKAGVNAQCNVTASSGDVANANGQYGIRWRKPQQPTSIGWQAWHQFRRRSDAKLRNANSQGIQRQRKITCRNQSQLRNISNASWWGAEPNVGRVANGVAARVDRLKAIGNGQVPLCAATAFELLRARLEE